MEFDPKLGVATSFVLGVLGLFLITRDKIVVPASLANLNPDFQNLNPIPKKRDIRDAEVIGDYFNEGLGGSVFRMSSGDVLKVVSLERDAYDDDPEVTGRVNRNQQEFIEDIYLQELEGKDRFPNEFVDIKHYNRGFAGPELVKLVNEELPRKTKHSIRVGEKIAYWVMEYVPTIGQGNMSKARIEGGKRRLLAWAKKNGYGMIDLHNENYGERKDGSFVAFDPWPQTLK